MLLLLDHTNNPYKCILQRACFFSAVTLLVLYLFQPFGTFESQITYKYLKLFGYGLVTFCAFVLAGFIELELQKRKLVKRYYHFVIPLIYLVLTALFNHGYFAVSVLGEWHWLNQLMFVFYVAAIGLFPLCFIFLVNKHARNIATTNSAKTNESANESQITSQKIELIGDNSGDQLTLLLDQLVYIKAADNYCEVGFLDDSPQQKLLRNSLSSLLAQLPDNTRVQRCHRSYAVNFDMVKSYSGNSAGLKLTTKMAGITIPVSRSYVKQVKQALPVTP